MLTRLRCARDPDKAACKAGEARCWVSAGGAGLVVWWCGVVVWWCGVVVERVKVGELLEIVELCPGLYTGVHCHTLQGRGRAAVWDGRCCR